MKSFKEHLHELGEGYEKVVLDFLQKRGVDASFKSGDLYVDKQDVQKTKNALKKAQGFDAKDLKVVAEQVIQEDGHSQIASADGTDLSLNDVAKQEVLDQLNAYVGAIGIREYINPKGALVQLQGKLATLGLSFDLPAMTEASGTAVAELTQFGGRFGKDVDTPYDEVINDDGISHRVQGGLKLEIQYERLQTGLTKVYAKIV